MKINPNSFFFIFFSLWSIVISLAQRPFYHQINAESGLPTNEVYRIIQDSQGYLWIGCDAGLYRYSGLEFKSYKNPKQNSRSISNLHIDVEGNLWCSNFTGQVFCKEKKDLQLINDYSEIANRFQVFFVARPGYYMIDKTGLSWYNEYGIREKCWKANFSSDKYFNASTAVFSERDGWIETPMGLFYMNMDADSLFSILSADAPTGYQTQRVFNYKNNNYLFRSEHPPSYKNYLYLLKNKKAYQLYEFSNTENIRYYFFYQDNLNNLWIGTSHGVWCINNIEKPMLSGNRLFPEQNISSIFHDAEGNYWFSSLQQGIFMIPFKTSVFYDPWGSVAIKKDITSLAMSHDGKLIIGHYNGDVGIFDILNNKCYYPSKINELKGLTVKDIEFHNNRIILSRGRLFLYDDEKKQVVYPYPYGNVRDLLIEKDTIYAMHSDCVVRFPINSIKQNHPIILDTIFNVGGKKIIHDPQDNHIYLGLNNGLYAWKNNRCFPVLLHNKKIFIHSMASNSKFVFAGTQTDGLVVLKNGKIITQWLFNEHIDDITPKVITCNDKYLWICTYSDFFRLDLKNQQIEKYSLNIGISPQDVTSMVFHQGYLYVGTKKYLHRIDAFESPVNLSIPQIFFTKVSLNDKPVNDSIFRIPYNFNHVKFEFISFSYRSKTKFFYQYRLLGLDTNWTQLSYLSPEVTYNSLPAGSYTFQVRSVNENGIYSNPAICKFTVASPPWQTWWFYLLLSLVSVSFIYSGFRVRLRLLERKAEKEKRVIVSQLSALKAQMNPHFMYNALNSIQALILQNDIKNSNLYLAKFSSLMRKVLDASGKEKIPLKEEVDILSLYLQLEKLRFGNDFEYKITIQPNVDEYTTTIPSMILQPFVENALKHGLLHKKGFKNLSIRFNLNDQLLVCEIEDNGIGRKKSLEINQRMKKGHSSFATQATDKRLELLNLYEVFKYRADITDLVDNQGNSLGTLVKIFIPQ